MKRKQNEKYMFLVWYEKKKQKMEKNGILDYFFVK